MDKRTQKYIATFVVSREQMRLLIPSFVQHVWQGLVESVTRDLLARVGDNEEFVVRYHKIVEMDSSRITYKLVAYYAPVDGEVS